MKRHDIDRQISRARRRMNQYPPRRIEWVRAQQELERLIRQKEEQQQVAA